MANTVIELSDNRIKGLIFDAHVTQALPGIKQTYESSYKTSVGCQSCGKAIQAATQQALQDVKRYIAGMGKKAQKKLLELMGVSKIRIKVRGAGNRPVLVEIS